MLVTLNNLTHYVECDGVFIFEDDDESFDSKQCNLTDKIRQCLTIEPEILNNIISRFSSSNFDFVLLGIDGFVIIFQSPEDEGLPFTIARYEDLDDFEGYGGDEQLSFKYDFIDNCLHAWESPVSKILNDDLRPHGFITFNKDHK